MDTLASVHFADADVMDRLLPLDDAALDELDFGVIGIDGGTVVRLYNRHESREAGLSPERVLGQPLFTVVAPCMNNFMVAHRFELAHEDGRALDETVDYVLTLRMRPVKVKLRLLARPDAPRRFVLVARRP